MFVRYPLILLLFAVFSSGTFSQNSAYIEEYTTQVIVNPRDITSFVSMTLVINNRSGDEYALVQIPFSKDSKVADISAKLVNSYGKVIKDLKKSEIYEKNVSSDDLFNDRFLKLFLMRHTEYPYKIIYSYQRVEKNSIDIVHWSPIYHTSIPVMDANLTVTIPQDMEYKVLNNKVKDLSDSKVGNNVVLKYNSNYLKQYKSEVYSVHEFPSVQILPLNFFNTFPGSWKSWNDYGEWICNLNQDLDLLTDSEKAVVAKLTSGKTDKREIIKVLYQYMQDHTRYINVSIGIGALKSFPASYVCVNKYGDCKALTTYMKAMLKEAGIKSYYVCATSAEFPAKFNIDFPSHQFNHMILMVPLENDTIWLENTSNLIPMGYVHSSIQNRPALLIDKGNSKLVMIPPMSAADVAETKNIDFNINATGTASATLKNRYKGNDYDYFLQLSSLLNEETKDKVIRRIMLFDNYDVKNWKINKAPRDSTYIDLNVELTLHKFLNPIGNDMYFTLIATGIPAFTNASTRTLPVTIPYPVNVTDTLKFILPEGYKLKNQPEPVNITTPFGSFRLSITENLNTITAVKHFELYPGECSLEQYPEFYKFIEAARKHDRSKVVVKQINL